MQLQRLEDCRLPKKKREKKSEKRIYSVIRSQLCKIPSDRFNVFPFFVESSSTTTTKSFNLRVTLFFVVNVRMCTCVFVRSDLFSIGFITRDIRTPFFFNKIEDFGLKIPFSSWNRKLRDKISANPTYTIVLYSLVLAVSLSFLVHIFFFFFVRASVHLCLPLKIIARVESLASLSLLHIFRHIHDD